MKYKFILNITFLLSIVSSIHAQVHLDSVSLISIESNNTQFCFNNSKLMLGNNVSDRYAVYFNSDSIFLNNYQSGIWTRRIAYTGSNINSATLGLMNDTIWVCWKEGFASGQIKARYSINRGVSWSAVLPVSAIGKVSAPSICASDNGKIHFVWSAENVTDTAVYHRAFYNGTFLSTPTILSNLTGEGLWPSVIAFGDTVLCAWKEGPLPTSIWFRSSFDGGVTWNPIPSAPTTTSLVNAKDPYLAYSYNPIFNTHNLYLAYDCQNKIYLQRSNDFGLTWTAPELISNTNKLSQFAHIDCNQNGFVGVSYEQRPRGTSLFDDSKKDVGFTYSLSSGTTGSFSLDTLAYTLNEMGSVYPALGKVDENNFYLAWLSRDSINQNAKVFERHIRIGTTSGIQESESNYDQLISIYPNPFSTYTNIEIKGKIDKGIIQVYNIYGQQIKRFEIHEEERIVITNTELLPGLYFLHLHQGNKFLCSKKLLVSH